MTKIDTSSDEEKSTIKIAMLDPLGQSIQGLKYQIRDGSRIVARGITDAKGRVATFVSDIGHELTVHVQRFASDEMKQVKTLFPWAEDFNVKLVSGKVKETVPLKPAQGDPGSYRRKTYIVKPRDTLGGIALQHKTTAEALAKLNGIRVTDIIRDGQVLKVPNLPEPDQNRSSTTDDRVKADKGNADQVTPAPPQKSEDRGSNGTPKTTLDFRCNQAGCIKIGMKGPLVEEINIRLMGFGSSVSSSTPLAEFTAETESAVKQFQRDYMGVPETGMVCGGMLRAIDEFARKYVVPINPMRCPCKRCEGFGEGRNDGKNVGINKAGVEHPGMHRGLIWLVRAALFYTAEKDSHLGFRFLRVESGYRCWDNNKLKNRTSTNHMGNALDLHFKRGDSTNNVRGSDLDELRSKIFMQRLGAQMRWKERNRPALEATSDGAVSWVHIDVRQYDKNFIQDRYYAVTLAGIDGTPLVELARSSGLLDLLNCGGVSPRSEEPTSDRRAIASLELSPQGLEFIKGWEKYGEKPYDDSEGYCTVGYGHLLGYKPCAELASEKNSDYQRFKAGVTEIEALSILKADVQDAIGAVRKYFSVPMYQHEFDALVSLAFNTGGFRKFKKLVSKMNLKNYSGACDEFADITNGGEAGLVKRRKAEMRMFRQNVYDSTH